MARPNRLEQDWPKIRKDILSKWDRLTEEEVDGCNYQFDRVVELIRKTYYAGRSHLTLEGDIRDWLGEKIEAHAKA